MKLLLLILTALALAATQMLAGGREIALCLPGYLLLALGAVLGWWPTRRTPIPRGSVECLAGALVFCAYISIRAIFSPEEYLARNDLYLALGAMAVYLIVALNLTSSKLRLLLVGVLLALALANCAIGAVQFFKGQNFMPFSFLPRADYASRASGFYGYPNSLSGFLEIALMLGLSVAFWSRWPSWAKMLVGYVCVMCALGILVTGSRGGYISATIGLLVFALLSLVLIGKLASGRVFALLLAGALLIGGGAWGVRKVASNSFLLQSRANQTLTVDVGRMRLWQAAWKQFRLHPVTGTGSGTYLYYGRQFRSQGVGADPVHAHNDYFELLAEYGILGIITAVIFLETHLRNGWTSFTRRLSLGADMQGLASNSLALTMGAISAASVCLAHSLLDYNLHMPANVLVAAFIFGLLASPGDGPQSTGDREESPGFPAFLRLAAPVLGILLALRILPILPAEYDAQRSREILSDWHHSVSVDPNLQMEDYCRRGLVWDPHNPELHFCLAEALSAQGDLATDPAAKEKFYNQSIESYTKALACAPGDVRLILALASALDGVRRFAESDPLFARALELDPKSGIAHNNVANHLLAQGKYPEAAVEYQKGIHFGAGDAGKAGLERIAEEQKANSSPPPPAPAPGGSTPN